LREELGVVRETGKLRKEGQEKVSKEIRKYKVN